MAQARKAPEKFVIFDWDNTLSHQAELGDAVRTLAFPEETKRLFRRLRSQGISIQIVSSQTSPEQIRACLELENIEDLVDNVLQERDKLTVLNRIKNENKMEDSGQIFLVEDSRSTCKKAENHGFSTILALTDENGLYVRTPNHLQLENYEAILDIVNQEREILLNKWECVRKIIRQDMNDNFVLIADVNNNDEIRLIPEKGLHSEFKNQERTQYQMLNFLRRKGINITDERILTNIPYKAIWELNKSEKNEYHHSTFIPSHPVAKAEYHEYAMKREQDEKLKTEKIKELEPVIKELENYAHYLKNDNRYHFFREPTKGDELLRLVNRLKQADSIENAKGLIDEFYDGKGKAGSQYELLNKGQGITTKVFHLKTTTIKKIDDIREKINKIDKVEINSTDVKPKL